MRVPPRLQPGLTVLLFLAVAGLIAAFLSPLASSAPDGLEHVTGSLGIPKPEAASSPTALLADYEWPGVRQPFLKTALAGVIGTALVAALGLAIERRRPR